MTIKSICKNILSILGASFCLSSNKKVDLLKLPESSQEIFINAQVENKVQANHFSNEIEKQNVQDYIKELNQTEIYLLVTKPTQKKLNNNILLMLHPENRLDAEKALIEDRATKFFYYSTHKRTKFFKDVHGRRLDLMYVLTTKYPQSLPKSYTTSNSYYVNNLGGYKSICPVFFDKNTAEDFLIQNSKRNFSSLALDFMGQNFKENKFSSKKEKDVEINTTKEVLEGILNSKIIKVGLGDFIEYYSSTPNQKFLKKIDFLFFPSSEELQSNMMTLHKVIPIKGFNFYQDKYFALKS
jgi:hypothetical protein